MKFRFLLLALLFTTLSLHAQNKLLQSGPMLGYSEMREALLWVQTTKAAEVQFVYWPKDNPDQQMRTKTVQTVKEEGFTAKAIADEVEPGIEYQYEVRINGKAVKLDYPTVFKTQALWQWRTDPPAVKFAVGSCTYTNEPVYDRPGKPYGGNYEIFSAIYKEQPEMMLWTGDNIYLREVDWYSWTGILKRYTHYRSLPEIQPLLASTHHYAIWDDHDFGPNDSDRSFIHKDKTLEAFKLFWGNPTYGLPDQKGITTQFKWADIDFFLLDNRYYRSPNRRQSGDRTILGEEQLEWLIDALSYSRASFKVVVVGGQVLNTAPVYENFANHHAEERTYLLNRIQEEGIRNVVFISGDRHHTELSKMDSSSGYPIYDLTVSPLTSGSARNVTETNGLRVEGTLVQERNYGIIEVEGPRGERSMKFIIKNSAGEELWTRTIFQKR
jgi:alkaline phosphatase D